MKVFVLMIALWAWLPSANADYRAVTGKVTEIAVMQDEKKSLLDYYQKTFDDLRNSITGLNEAQLLFKPSNDRWSISECLEHIIATESQLFVLFKSVLQQPENPERRKEIKVTDEQIKQFMLDRKEKYPAPENLQPSAAGKYTDPAVALADLEKQREQLVAFLGAIDTDDLRNRVNDTPSGPTDAYQSFLFLAAHTARHTLQIEEVKASEGFPM